MSVRPNLFSFRKLKQLSLFSAAIVSSSLLVGCNAETWCKVKGMLGFGAECAAQAAQAQGGPPVGVFTLKPESFPITSELPGRISAYRTAEIRPQVNGVILNRLFEEGADVESGISLYQIDPAPFEAVVKSAENNLLSAKASAEIAGITVNRLRSLVGSSAVSRQDYDTAVANKRQADAAVATSQAALENAKINLGYTKVMSPIAGRIGRSNFTEGALVSTSQTQPLTTIHQLDKVLVDIPQSSIEYQTLRNKIAQGVIKKEGKAKVQLMLENGEMYPYEGQVEFSDISVDPTTGAVNLRAEFPNPELTLLPGMFVRAVIYEGTQENAILAPQQAVNRTPTGDASVFVVTAENTLEPRIIKASKALGNKWLVDEGLKAGERVVVSGMMIVGRLPPGTPVSPTEEDPNAPKAPATPQEGAEKGSEKAK